MDIRKAGSYISRNRSRKGFICLGIHRGAEVAAAVIAARGVRGHGIRGRNVHQVEGPGAEGTCRPISMSF